MSRKPSPLHSFLAELQRRHVYKVGAMYCVGGWLLVQVVTQVLPVFDVSALGQRILVLIVVAGFPVALVLAWLFDLTPQGIVRTADAVPEAESPGLVQQRRGMERKLNVLLGLLLLGAIGYVAWEHLGSRGGAQQAGGNDKSIAVLPFANLSDDKANAYFSTGVQDEILTRLAKIGALKVISRTSTQHFASSPDNLPEIARQLGVSAILEGSVQKAGDAVHINVQLIRAATDEHLWAESYNRKLDDMFGVEGEVAQTIAEALSATLTGAEKQQLAQKPTANPQAYDAYLRALGHEGRFSQSPGDLQEWAGAYAEAVRLDPGFAVAWAGLSRVYVEWYFDVDTRPQRLQQAKDALDQARQLAPDAAETYEALGLYRYWGLGDYEGAYEAYSEALKRKPNASSVLNSMGNVRRRQGHWEEALALQQRAAALDPLNGSVAYNIALTYRALRHFDEAQAALNRGLAAAPGDLPMLAERAYTEQARGDLRAAHAYAEQIPLTGEDGFSLSHRFAQWHFEHDDARVIAEVGQILQHGGDLDTGNRSFLLGVLGAAEIGSGAPSEGRAHLLEARKILEAQRAAGDTSFYPYILMTLIASHLGDREAAEHYAALAEAGLAKDAMGLPQVHYVHAMAEVMAGDKAQAIELLQKAQSTPTAWGAFPAMLRADPTFDPLRGDPAFDKLTADPTPVAAAHTP